MVNVIAHRGFSGLYPEHTEVAIRKALELGVDAIEFDVRLTRDGEFVVIHDDTVDRTSDGAGSVKEMTLKELKELDFGVWFDPAFSGQRILTLSELLDLISGRVRMNVHLKADSTDRAQLVEGVVEALVGRQLLEKAFIASDEETVRLVREVEPRLATCNLTTKPPETYIERSLAMGCTILQPRNRPNKERLERSFVEQAHRYGLEVNPFYADTPDEMRRLIACGVDGILTNRPDLLIQVRTSSGAHA